MNTPWGKSDYEKNYGQDGIKFYGTPSHGGFWVPAHCRRDMQVPIFDESLRNPRFAKQCADGWFEEDCDFNFVIVSFPELFTADEIKASQNAIKAWYPKVWEKLS
jgi:hypothetical protein